MALAVNVGPVQYGGPAPALRQILSDHFHRLGKNSRNMRFRTYASDPVIDQIVQKLSPDCVIGIEVDGETRGVLEIHRSGPGHAEIGISVEDAYQGHGYGRQLFEAGLIQAKDMNIATAELHFARGNIAILQMVRSVGAELEFYGSDCIAKINIDNH